MSHSETTSGWPVEATSASDASTGGKIGRDLSGQTLGDDFQVERLLGRGGMGEVYLARQISLNRPVALKVLRSDLASNPTYLSRFEVEATAVARLNHPNIVQVYTLGRHDTMRFIAMEYVQGTNLRDYLIKKGTVALPLALSIMRQTCQAMTAAGEIGLIHRDIKPENLMLTRKGQVKVADFGLCREQGSDTLHLTQEGVTLGTPMYMSPEQVQGKALDHRSDLYSMGVTFYQMLAGVPPFRAETAMALALKHLQEKPVSLAVHRPDLPRELVDLVMKLMAKSPADRYSSAKEVDRELIRIREIVAASNTVTTPTESLEISSPTTEPSLEPRRRGVLSARQLRERMAEGLPVSGPWVLGTLVGLGLLVGVALGWSDRPPNLLAGGAPTGPPAVWIDPSWVQVPRLESAREQFRHAQIEARPSRLTAALLAVPGHHPDQSTWAVLAYTHLARHQFRRLDRDGLDHLADSLEAVPDSQDRMVQLAGICRAAVATLEHQPAEALAELTTLGTEPAYLDPGMVELALEITDLARALPDAQGQDAQWTNLQNDLLQALHIEAFDPSDRFEPGPRTSGRS